MTDETFNLLKKLTIGAGITLCLAAGAAFAWSIIGQVRGGAKIGLYPPDAGHAP